MKKVLILGSGALKIGEAGEFDYSGSQAIKSLKEEHIKTILINPNIATIQTSENLADKVYFLPVNDHFASRVIEREKPDGLLLSFGGQTALNCGMLLHKKGILKKYNVAVLGTPIESVIISEDRQKFARHLRSIDIPTPPSEVAYSFEQAKEIAKKLGYPLMVRAGYSLGGQKSGIVTSEIELKRRVEDALAFSPQVLVEKYLHHYKEVEYEVVRDRYDNCVTVCNMENMDPLGIHTGESIVVAPSQTLTNFEYHFLRKQAIKIVKSLGIIGECNVQYALNPRPDGQIEYYVIELNARLSRSSALASKATGYPLAYVAAKLALGESLTDIPNQVTKTTQSFFEPALDYLVVKIPRWDFSKFQGVEEKIGSSMKSVGEVMAIGRTFEEAVQKAVRMLETGAQGVTENHFPKSRQAFLKYLRVATSKRVFAIAEGLKRGISVAEIYKMTGIDPWFIYRIKNIVDAEQDITHAALDTLNKDTFIRLKQLGFSDKKIAILTATSELTVRARRLQLGIVPSVFQIDTMAGEVPAKTNYLYLTYNGFHHDVAPLDKKGVIVLGSGPYRIGSSVEFDWSCVNTVAALKTYDKLSIVVNCNPETVSTDYDISDRLYFEELSFERVADIWDFEHSAGVIISVGGQTPNNLARSLSQYGVSFFGTQAEDIDRAEDRNKFSALLDTLNIPQPYWRKFSSLKQIHTFLDKIGYPVLVRPSYVLSGSAMNVCYSEKDLINYVRQATKINTEYPVTVSKFIQNAKEIELDGVAQNGQLMAYVISEHVEHAGVHSGDATIVYPPQRIYLRTEKKIIDTAIRLVQALRITGPFNIQFIAKENDVYVIEMNVRASRTLPFVSKATRINFANLVVDAFFDNAKPVLINYPDYVVVKSPQFSFARLEGADPVLRVEMSSTGETGAFGKTVEEAFLKSEIAVGNNIPQRGVFISLGGTENKVRFLQSALRIKELGLRMYATEKTAHFLKTNGIKAKRLYKIHENKKPNILSYFQNGKIDMVINISDPFFKKEINDDYIIRRAAIDHNIQLFTNRQKADLFIKALSEYNLHDLEVKPWDEYL
jgi:carbamoyl-phosphate synthase large subunit